MRSRRMIAAAVAGTLLLAACGDGDDSGDAGGGVAEESNDDVVDAESPAAADEVEVDPASDTAANVLPDVVVDDLQAGNEVNLRNVAPSDTPTLIWMWAPH